MKKTRLLLAIITMAFGLPVMAQWSIGASGGYALNFYNYDPQYMVGLNYMPHHGFSVEIPVRCQINERLALSSGLALQQKGYVLHGSYTPTGTQEAYSFYPKLTRNDYYFSLPIMAEYVFGHGKWNGFAGIGGYVGWWTGSVFVYRDIQSISQISYSYPIHQSVKLTKGVDRRIELGLVGELGVQLSLNDYLNLFAALNCFYALTPQQLDYQMIHFPSRNTTLSLQVGALFNLKNN